MKNKLLIILAVISIFLISCIKEKNKGKTEILFFNFDSTMVEENIEVNGDIRFNLPLGMLKLDNTIDTSQMVESIPFNISADSLKIFFNPENLAVLLTTVTKSELSEIQNDILVNTPLKLHSDQLFYKENILINQYVYSDDDNIMLILLMPDQDSVAEFIFFIPKEKYNDYSKVIESTIGSIKEGGSK